ncbi:MAG: hypothetical protein R6V57_02440 [Vicinamibacterales bacterium]
MAHRKTVLSLALASLVLLPASAYVPPEAITRIDCPGAASTYVRGINSAGRVVGAHFDTLGWPSSVIHGFIWEGGGCEPIPGLPDGWIPLALNDAGHVVGVRPLSSGQLRGFLYQRGQVTNLVCPPTVPRPCAAWPGGVNNRGQIVGWYEINPWPDRPFVWEDGSFAAPAELPWDHITVRAHGIDARGDVVGEFYPDGPPPHITYAYYWPNGGAPVWFGFPIEGNVPPVAKTTVPTAVNQRGDTVGYFYDSMYDEDPAVAGVIAGPCRGFFRDRDGAMIELKVPDATYTCPGGINAAGEVSGVYTTDAVTTPLSEIRWRGFVAKVGALVER